MTLERQYLRLRILLTSNLLDQALQTFRSRKASQMVYRCALEPFQVVPILGICISSRDKLGELRNEPVPVLPYGLQGMIAGTRSVPSAGRKISARKIVPSLIGISTSLSKIVATGNGLEREYLLCPFGKT